MIDIGKILGRAWHVLWNYKVLWIFGILVVLMGGGSAGPNFRVSGNNGNNGYQGVQIPNPPAFIQRTNEWFDTYAQPWFDQHVNPLFATPESLMRTVIWMVVILLALGIVAWLLTSLVRYPSESAVIRMVDDYEQSGAKLGFREGWKLGWSRRAFRLWLIDLIISLPAFVLAVIAMITGLSIAAKAVTQSTTTPWVPSVGSIIGLVLGIGFLALLVVLVSVFLGLLRPFIARKAVLEEAGTGESFRNGWAMVKGNWQSAGLMWLVMIGLGIAYALLSILLIIALVPVFLVTAVAAAIVAAIPAGLAFWIASLTSIAPLAWIVAILAGMPFFLLVLLSPLWLIGGWVHVFKSSVWTLTYREIKALENLAPVPAKSATPSKA